jgi:leucyl aminopeptidase
MVKKAVKKSELAKVKKQKSTPLLGFTKESWLSAAKLEKAGDLKVLVNAGHVFFFGQEDPSKEIAEQIGSLCEAWQLDLVNSKKDISHIQSKIGPIWVVKGFVGPKARDHYGLLDETSYGRARDLVGACVPRAREYELKDLRLVFIDASPEQKLGAFIGLEVGAYTYKSVRYRKGNGLPQLHLDKADSKVLAEAEGVAVGINIARHLVNIPGGELNPKSYSGFIEELFVQSSHCKVTVWTDEKLKAEGLELLRTVGRGAEFPSELVRISYRPSTRKKGLQPIAFIGKGVTFDTGGLDLKPSQFMRLMKKDMGGSATLVGLGWWLSESKPDVPCDIYLALAENSVDAKSMRPGDILEARNGKTIEIHNTDAEGRLVLADAMLVAAAQTGADRPVAMIDAATLTGAMRVALGTKVAGLCANHDGLADAILAASQKTADPCWRIPLLRDCRELLRSSVADLSNCSASPYAGAVTAALFLEEFISSDIKWAHLDMMAWAEKPGGAICEAGGNGQMVQALVRFLLDFEPGQLA